VWELSTIQLSTMWLTRFIYERQLCCRSHNIILLTSNKSIHIPVHSMYALPVVPGGQMHFGWWSLPMQTAESAHVSLSQTSRHTLLSRSQASSSAQSSLYWHTTEIHDNRGFPCVPAGHTHCARWAWTWHSAPLPHWLPGPNVQGFKQLPLIQALS
jgi:hypothetical protein